MIRTGQATSRVDVALDIPHRSNAVALSRRKRHQPSSMVTVISAPVLVMTLTAMLRPGVGGANG